MNTNLRNKSIILVNHKYKDKLKEISLNSFFNYFIGRRFKDKIVFTNCKIVYQVVFWRSRGVLQKTEYLKDIYLFKSKKK